MLKLLGSVVFLILVYRVRETKGYIGYGFKKIQPLIGFKYSPVYRAIP